MSGGASYRNICSVLTAGPAPSASSLDTPSPGATRLNGTSWAAWIYWTFNRRRRALLASIDGDGKFVLQTQLRENEEVEAMTRVDCSQLFLQAMGCDTPHEVTGFAAWLAGRALPADKFYKGRVFLGDYAVHLFTPTGGMGYNTSIEDAVNIVGSSRLC